ncbi:MULTISPECIES: hypothetical protein [Microbacterium]|uniref:hypothetical protein n=1 Tax=Microbacterium TaxID=33882 RepID=UPI00217ED412|nr:MULTISPECIES: hypothetical protein [Microbacterium]UWF76598.1 hypothetical protein JSY13_06805 [Microbacterium neungamense]WCM54750.1 hypothetical protein JRG78_06835 [Microbacterium sp. EF45047]
MRRSSAALSVLALSALALTGCSGAPGFDGAACERTSTEGLADAVTASGELGDPEAELVTPVGTDEFAYADLIVGDGRATTSPTQGMILTFALYDGTTGSELGSGTRLWDMDSLEQQIPGMQQMIPCVTEGSRVVASLPAKELPEGMAEQIGLSQDDSIVGVFDVIHTLLAKAEGRHLFHDAHGLPTVVRAADGRPGVIIPDASAPTKPVVQTLIEGDGDKVGEDAPLFRHTAVDWADRSVTSSSWGTTLGTDPSVLPQEVADAVTDATIGSQLLVVVPGEAKGDAAVYVVDVLGVIPPDLAG